MHKTQLATCYAILAAALYAINAPVSKLLLQHIPSTMMAGLLYLGAGLGMFLLGKVRRTPNEQPLTRAELPSPIFWIALAVMAAGTYFASAGES
ncbi:MAG: EamA family transporter [Butyricicoccus sp.]|nr:EamA family transporter [Butyricicoccus sp.]